MIALLFLALCAWCGAWLRGRLGAPEAAAAEPEARTVPLDGLCLRSETALCLPAAAALTVEDGERVPVGGLLARLPDGTPVRAERSALYFRAFDGLESLDAAALEPFCAETLRALFERKGLSPSGCRGRLVLDNVLYYAALAPANAALPEPGPCLLRFAGRSELLPARLLAVSRSETGNALLFRLDRGGDYLSLRRTEAELYT